MKRICVLLLLVTFGAFASACDEADPVRIVNYNLEPSVYAVVGRAYQGQINVSGGSVEHPGTPGEYTFSVISGALPAGLSLGAHDGLISGTATTAAEEWIKFRVKVTDTGAPADLQTSAERDFQIKVINSNFQPDAYEPLDDHYSTVSNSIKVGQTPQLHNMHVPDDVDYVVVDLTGVAQGSRLMIETRPVAGQDTGYLNMYLHYYTNPTGNPVHYGEALDKDSHAMMFFRKGETDKYYLRLGGDMQAYTISVFLYEGDEYENDDSAMNTGNTVGAAGVSQFHTLTAGDQDWIKLDFRSITPGAYYHLQTDHMNGGKTVGTVVRLYDENQNLLTVNDTSDWVTNSKWGEIYYQFVNAGIYYLQVVADGSAEAEYMLMVDAYTPFIKADSYETQNDDEMLSTTNLMLPGDSLQNHTLHQTGDVDYVQLDLRAVAVGTEVLINVARGIQNSPASVKLTLYNAGGLEVASDWFTNSSDTLSSITYPVAEPGIYYAKVDSVLNDIGDYSIELK